MKAFNVDGWALQLKKYVSGKKAAKQKKVVNLVARKRAGGAPNNRTNSHIGRLNDHQNGQATSSVAASIMKGRGRAK